MALAGAARRGAGSSHPFSWGPLLIVAVGLAISPGESRAQEFPDSLWNYVQTPWLNFVFGLATAMDVTAVNQDQQSRDHVGEIDVRRPGQIRAIRGYFLGQVRILGRPYDYVLAGAYLGFDVGLESPGQPDFKLFDLAISVPMWSDVRANVGLQKEPFSHDRVMGMIIQPFSERASYLDALARSRNVGILFERWSRTARWKWAVGFYNDWLDSPETFSESSQQIIGRVNGLVIDQEEARGRFLHIGGSFNVSDNRPGVARIRGHPEAFFAPYLVDTGDFAMTAARSLALESTWISGPWWLSGEVVSVSTRSPDMSNPGGAGTSRHRGSSPASGDCTIGAPAA